MSKSQWQRHGGTQITRVCRQGGLPKYIWITATPCKSRSWFINRWTSVLNPPPHQELYSPAFRWSDIQAESFMSHRATGRLNVVCFAQQFTRTRKKCPPQILLIISQKKKKLTDGARCYKLRYKLKCFHHEDWNARPRNEARRPTHKGKFDRFFFFSLSLSFFLFLWLWKSF